MLYQPIYDPTSPDGLVFLTGNLGQFFSTNPILQEACRRIDLMATRHRVILATRFRLPVPDGYNQTRYEAKVEQYFNLLRNHAEIYGLDFHYVWAREQIRKGCPLYHVIALVDDDKPVKDINFISEVENAWRWVTGTEDVDLDVWCYGEEPGGGVHNLIKLEHPSPSASAEERNSLEADLRAHFGLCLWWTQSLAEVAAREDKQNGVPMFGASPMR